MKLQGPKGGLQVIDLGLEIVYRLSDGQLQFRGFGLGWGVVSNLDGSGHGDYFDEPVERAYGKQVLCGDKLSMADFDMSFQ